MLSVFTALASRAENPKRRGASLPVAVHRSVLCAVRFLWRADAVEAGGMIRPLGIAEIGGLVRKSIRLHRHPGGIDQVRAGFHYDGNVGCPGDDETESVGLHSCRALSSG